MNAATRRRKKKPNKNSPFPKMNAVIRRTKKKPNTNNRFFFSVALSLFLIFTTILSSTEKDDRHVNGSATNDIPVRQLSVKRDDTIDMTFSDVGGGGGGGEAESNVKGNSTLDHPPSGNDVQKQKTKPPSLSSSITLQQMTNNHLRDKGVLLRTKGNPAYAKHFDENGRDYLPTSFVHASMRAPNVVFRKDKYAEARVAYLIASKFERHSPVSELPNKVDCRAYYPVDAWSGERDHKIFNNLVGTSCKPQRQKKILSSELYNATNRCSCNYDQVPGGDLASYLIRHNITNIPPNRNGRINRNFCWYPGTPRGIRELIAASNSLYLNREKLFRNNRKYHGWTECSASPNLQDDNMIDALVIELPLLKSKTGDNYSNIGDLRGAKVLQLKENLEGFAHLKLPVLLLREKRGMGEEECSLLWEGKACNEGYSKEFVSVEFLFGDGSCLAKARGDAEVRFHKSNSGDCPKVPNTEEIQHPTMPNSNETLDNTTIPSLWASYISAKNNPTTSAESKEHDTMRTTIILTGDIHGHFLPPPCNQSDLETICYRGAPYLASVINTVRSVEDNVVLLDSGDVVFGSAQGDTYENIELVADTMNLLQYDAMALGNHELDFGLEKLHHFFGLLKFPVLASNVLRLGHISTSSYAAISLGNKHRNDTLCVVGITANEPNPMVKNLLIGPEIDAVKDVLHDLSMNQQCSRLVILSHAGIDVDRALANEFASDKKINVDVILGGHSHFLIPSPDTSHESSEFGTIPVTDTSKSGEDAASAKKRPPILHTGANGRYIGLLRLEWNVSSNKMIKVETEILPLDEDHGVYPDHDFMKGLERRQKRINDHHRPEEGNRIQFRGFSTNNTAASALCGKPCRQGDCILGQVITDAMKACLDAGPCSRTFSELATREANDTISNVFAFLEAGTIRNCLHPTHQDFNEILQWPNKLVLLQVNGGLILKMLQHGLSTLSNHGGGFLQVSGLQYSYTKDHQIQHSTLSPSLLDDDSSYWVVTTDWLAAGGDGYGHLIDQASSIIETNVSIHEALSFYRASNPGLVYTLPPQHHQANLLQTHARKHASSSNGAIAGFIGGALSFLLTFPIYAIFIKKAVGAPVVFSRRLFNGVWMGVLATGLSNGIYFMIYKSECLHLQPNWMRSFLAAVSNSIVTAPLWMLITWQQLTVDQNSSSSLKTAKVIYKSRGIWGFFDSLPYNIIMCIHPTVRQVFLEIIVGNSSFGFTGSIGIGIAASIASLLATIITYPIQKSRIVWQSSRQHAIRDIESGCSSIITCDMIGTYMAFLSGIGSKLTLTCLNNFLLFFLMEKIDCVLRYWRC